MKVYVGTPTHGAPRIEYIAGFILMREYEMTKPNGGCHWIASNFECGPYIGGNRNKLVHKMYDRDCEALFMVDHDVYCPPETLSRMVEIMEQSGLGIVAGDLILGNDAKTTGFFDGEEDGEPCRYSLAERPIRNGEQSKVALVNAVATSCILIHRRVFDAISAHRDDPPWFGPGTWFMHWPVKATREGKPIDAKAANGLGHYWTETGEDFSFCKRARAVGEKYMGLAYDLGLAHHKVGRMIVEKMTAESPPTLIGAK